MLITTAIIEANAPCANSAERGARALLAHLLEIAQVKSEKELIRKLSK